MRWTVGDDDAREFGLVMPFVVVASNGGPYDDDAYVAGYEAGLVDAMLSAQPVKVEGHTVRTANVLQVDLLAMHHGFTCTAEDIGEGWSVVDLRRAADSDATS
jgi:hypothetical protein